jgi:hypothetical protein
MASKYFDKKVTTLLTSNATPAVIATYTIAAGSSVFAEAKVVALAASDDASAFHLRTGAKRLVGIALLVGTLDSFSAEDDAATNAVFSVSGNDLQVEVTGIALTDVNWMCELTIVQYTP